MKTRKADTFELLVGMAFDVFEISRRAFSKVQGETQTVEIKLS
jgi:hypothetical protein